MKLKPIKDEKALAAVPLDEPVLVLLDPEPTVDDDAPEPAKAEPEKKEDGATLLQKQLEAAQQARLKAEKDTATEREARAKAEKDLAAARVRTADSESDAVASGLAAAQAERDNAKAAVKAAFEEGNAEKLAEAQEKLGRASADIREFERAQVTMAERKEQEAKTPVVEQPKPPADVNEMIDRMQLLPAERDWLKEHPDSLMDRGRNIELDAAYIKATRKGLVRGTADYFKFIEGEMGYVTPAKDDDTDEERTPIVAAPVSRESRSSLSNERVRPNTVQLTPQQREMAALMGVSDVEYARGVQQMDQEKRVNPEKYAAR